MLPIKFRFIWSSGFRKGFQKLTNQKQELHMAAMFVNISGLNENLNRGPPIDALVHLDKRFQRRRLKCDKLTDDRRQAMSKDHIAFGKVT